MDDATRYVTTDLVLYTTADLTALAAALDARGLDVRDGPCRVDESLWYWRIQAGGEESYEDPEPEVAAILAAIEALDPPERSLWDGCTQRVFDLGYDCGIKPFSVRHDLSTMTLARLAAAGGLLRFTLYAFDPNQSEPETCSGDAVVGC